MQNLQEVPRDINPPKHESYLKKKKENIENMNSKMLIDNF